ncbi:MAG: tetratricopeptide repeat protein [Cyclobacteriaceae bacterium]
MRFICIFLLSVFVGGCQARFGNDKLPGSVQAVSDESMLVDYLLQNTMRNPDRAENFLRLVVLLNKQNRNSEAIEAALKGLKSHPGNQALQLQLAYSYFQNGNYNLAREAANSILVSDDLASDYYLLQSNLSFQAGNYLLALNHINRAMRIDASNPAALESRAHIHLAMRDTLGGIRWLNQAWEIEPNIETLNLMGSLAIESGETTMAREFLEKGLRTNPDNAELTLNYAYFLDNVGKPDTAIQIVKKLYSKFPEEQKYSMILARSFLKTGRSDSALVWVDKALEINKDRFDVWLLKSQVLDRRNQLQDAIEACKRAIAIDSTSVQATDHLSALQAKATYLYRLREREQLRKEIETFPEIRPIKIQP